MARQVDVGTSDGSGTFALSHLPTDARKVRVWASSFRNDPNFQFTISGQTVTWVTGWEPPSGDSIIADYLY